MMIGHSFYVENIKKIFEAGSEINETFQVFLEKNLLQLALASALVPDSLQIQSFLQRFKPSPSIHSSALYKYNPEAFSTFENKFISTILLPEIERKSFSFERIGSDIFSYRLPKFFPFGAKPNHPTYLWSYLEVRYGTPIPRGRSPEYETSVLILGNWTETLEHCQSFPQTKFKVITADESYAGSLFYHAKQHSMRNLSIALGNVPATRELFDWVVVAEDPISRQHPVISQMLLVKMMKKFLKYRGLLTLRHYSDEAWNFATKLREDVLKFIAKFEPRDELGRSFIVSNQFSPILKRDEEGSIYVERRREFDWIATQLMLPELDKVNFYFFFNFFAFFYLLLLFKSHFVLLFRSPS
jgi:hypothetical protein